MMHGLVQKRQGTFDAILAVVESSPVPESMPGYDHEVSEFITEVTLSEKSGNLDTAWFVRAKERLNILADLHLGIISEYKIAEDETRIYLRDARNQQQGIQKESWENWAIMGLSTFQIVRQLYLNAEFDVKEIEEDAVAFLKEISNARSPQEYAYQWISCWHQKVREKFELGSNEEATALINRLRDFGNFEELPCALVTLSSVTNDEGKKTNFATIDVPMFQLTENQQLEYMRVLIEAGMKEKIPNQFNTVLSRAEALPLPAWYSKIKIPNLQAMVLHYIPHILEGRQIPTQMIDLIPGLRNAGEEGVYELGGEAPKLISRTFHAGSIGQDTKAGYKENVRLTAENMRQYQQLTGAKKVLVSSWISPMMPSWLSGFGFANESRLHYVQEAAAKQINAESKKEGFSVTYSNTPLEYTRVFLSSDFKVENEIWEGAKRAFGKYGILTGRVETLINGAMRQYPDGMTLEQAKGIIEKAPKEKHEFEELNDKSTEILAKIFLHMFELQRIRESRFSFLSGFGLQKNARRAVESKLIQSLVSAIDPDASVAYVSACKSGKDREGFLAILTHIKAMASSIMGKSVSLTQVGDENGFLHRVAESEVAAGHVVTRAGLQAGTEGAKGIKNEGYILSTWMKSLFKYITRTEASSNKAVKKDKRVDKGYSRDIAVALGAVVNKNLKERDTFLTEARYSCVSSLDDESVEGVQMGRPSTILAHASDGSLPRASLISREGSRAVSPVAFADSDDGDTQEERTSLHD